MKKEIFLLVLTAVIFSSFTYPSWEKAEREIFPYIRKLEKLLPVYMAIAEKNPDNYRAQWKVAELCVYMWQHYMRQGKKKKAFQVAKIGLKYGERAVKINPSGIEGLFWYAVIGGGYATLIGPLRALQWGNEKMKLLKRLMSLDPEAKYKDGGWAIILGKVYIFAPPFPIGFGDPDKGITILKFALKHHPHNGYIRNYLAEGYMRLGKLQVAEKLLKENIKMLKSLDLTIYENKSNLMIAQNLLNLLNICKKQHCDSIPALMILSHEYQAPTRSN